MSWTDLGVIFEVKERAEWMHSHFYVPTAIALNDRIRVFGACWDRNIHGRLGFIDVDLEDPTVIIGYSSQPLLPDSSRGKFDCDGGHAAIGAFHGRRHAQTLLRRLE